MDAADVYPYVDEIAAAGVTTLYLCRNYGMPVTYGSHVTPMFGHGLTAEQKVPVRKMSQEKPSLERGAINLESVVAAGHSPVGLVIDRAWLKGLEAFITFRPMKSTGLKNQMISRSICCCHNSGKTSPRW